MQNYLDYMTECLLAPKVHPEELEANRGKGYTATSMIGKAGLEKQYEERLKGKDGVEIYIEGEDNKCIIFNP